MPEKKAVCKKPFVRLEIYEDGECGSCCPPFIDNYTFGNLFTDDIDTIWNGEKIKKFRRAILDNSYKYCHTDMCRNVDCICIPRKYCSETILTYPEEVEISLDGHCNSKCVFCRDEYNRVDKESFVNMKNILDSKIIPLLANCRNLALNGIGEFFISKLSQDLVLKTSVLYPNLKYTITTNGILCTPKKLKELNILNNRIELLSVSLHAVTEKTHEIITRSGKTFNKVISNIEDCMKLKNEGEIGNFCLNFVICSLNYKELPLMADYCNKNHISGNFWEFRKWGDLSLLNIDYDTYNVTNPNHPEYRRLKEILKEDIFDSEFITLNGVLQDIREN